MNQQRSFHSPSFRLWAWLMVLLFSATATTAFADELDKDKNFTVTEYKDHVHFSIMIMDGKGKDTWCRVGSIHAYSEEGQSGTHLHLMDVECDQGEDNSTNKEIYSRNVLTGSKAFLTNATTGSNTVIDFADWSDWGDGNNDDVRKKRPSKVKYTITKTSSELRPTVEIDFYWNADMAGQKWYFNYEFIHNGGSTKNRNMGSAFCSRDLGLGQMNINDFSYTRKSGNKIDFTVPALPNDVPANLQDFVKHYGEYEIDFIYTLYDGTTKTQHEYLSCVTGQKKTFELTIPSDVGNFKQADMRLSIHWGLQWSNKKVKGSVAQQNKKSDIFPSVPVPYDLVAEFKQFDGQAALSWNAYAADEATVIKESVPYIYRREVGRDGTPVKGATWSKQGYNNEIGDQLAQGFTDRNLTANTMYQYMVMNVPKAWESNKSISNSDLDSPSESLINQLGHCLSNVVGTAPSVSIYSFKQDTTVTDKVRLTWEYSRVPVSTDKVDFEIWKRQKGSTEWQSHGKVNVAANPAFGTVASFTDAKLPSPHETFEYKVVLSLNDGKNTFESDVITAGLLTGSAVLTVDATKGTHSNAVRVRWTAKQIGTDNTSFEVSRRYAGTNDEFLTIYSVSGTNDTYTYEDNTVQPGYYYEYKVSCYSGEKASYTDNTFQNELSDIGFTQSRGVISGRVTFGTGTAVENVRISLRSTDEQEGSNISGYSMRFDGGSEGIKWDADSTVSSKLFGTDKDYTVQFFVRPDAGLAEGAVVGEIPFYGRLLLGQKDGSNYRLLVEKYSKEQTTRNAFSHYWNVRCIACDFAADRDTSKPTYYFDGIGGEVYTDIDQYEQLRNQLLAEGYSPVAQSFWYEMTDVNVEVFGKQMPLDVHATIDELSWEGTRYDTGLDLQANNYSLVTLKNNGSQVTVMVNDSISPALTQKDTKQYHIPGGNINELYPEYEVWNDNCLYYYAGGVKRDLFDSYYEQTTNKYSWYPSNSTGISTLSKDIYNPFAVGGSQRMIYDEERFTGNITEVRVWNHALSANETASYADRVMNGRETGLRLYWPMDEGLDRYVFDASYANDVPNGRHATVGSNIRSSILVPSETQLSRYGMTNSNGEYIIRGIPFVGTGSTYTLSPSKNIHKFSPSTRNGFIGSGSLALNNYDFTDQSSFPVRGTVTYLNTNIPADSIQFKIDGALVQDKNGASMSGSNGEFDISVPIGEHLIEAYRNGHRLTSFPLDGSTYDFKQAETINFIDSTLVNVTGRINGGFSDQDEPLGFGRSVNRLGQATIKLSLGKESQCSFNYIVNERGEGSFGKTDLPVESATDKIKSTARRAGGEHDDTYYIYITTDPATGEYSAMLPPLKYKVESITFDGGTDYDAQPIFATNLPMIDATNTLKETMKKDTLVINGTKQTYEYSAKMIRQYRSRPVISVVQKGMKNGAFGEIAVPVTTDNIVDSVKVVNFTDTGYEYVYGHPLFRQDQTYEFDIDVYEQYVNLDTKEEFKEIPRDAKVGIVNDASISTAVYAEKAMVDGHEVVPGEVYNAQSIEAKTDEKGHISYKWIGGWPNLAGENLRNITIDVFANGRTTMWQAPDSSGDALDLILLGSLVSGNNFVTSGPDHVDMVLRRPPGSTSVASLQNETITTKTTLTSSSKSKTDGGGIYVSPTPTFEVSTGNILGIAILTKSKLKVIENQQAVWTVTDADVTSETETNTYTVTEQMKTPSNSKYVQNQGDTYIGRASNLLFGKGRALNLFKQQDGTYRLQQKDAICVGQSFTTTFVYPQAYILKEQIPNWQAIIDSKLEHVDGDLFDENVAKRVPGVVKYYTNYRKGDPQWGKSNADEEMWTQEQYEAARGCPSYRMVDGTGQHAEDELNWYIEQIRLWQDLIAENEEDKLKAFANEQNLEDNYSIAGGTSVSKTSKTQHSENKTNKHTHTYAYNGDAKMGLMLNDAGIYGIIKVSGQTVHSNDTTNVETSTKTVAWTLSDAEWTTALSVDVYKSPKGWGPIFRTRGGQTSNPYEDATYTLFYDKGKQLDEATMRVEYPQLRVNGATHVADVPVGGTAKFELELSNLSETNTTCNYILEAIEASNPQGAILTIDGSELSMGRSGRVVRMQGKETITKTLMVSQSDRSVTQYKDIRLVLRSDKDTQTHSDTIRLSVDFMPASAIVEMKVSRTVLNQADYSNNGGFQTTIFNLDRQDSGLRGLRIQYRRKGTDAWNVAKQWSLNAYDQQNGYDPMPDGSTFSTGISFPDDGEYELRAQTFGTFSTDPNSAGGDEVTYETAIINVVQDLRGPKVLGMPYPTTGTLMFHERNDMHVRFNETLNGNALSHTDNFVIEGYLNNTADEAYADVAYQLNGDVITTQATYALNDKDVAFGTWFYRQSDGIILDIGDNGEHFTLSTINGGKVLLGLGRNNESIQTDVVLPADKWNYIAMSYRKSTAEDPSNYITVMYVNAETENPVYIVKDQIVDPIIGEGPVSIGGFGMKGMMYDLTLWDSDKTVLELVETRDEQKANYTPGLIGYWQMDEGRGTTMADKARSHDFTLPAESWYINNRNLAAHLDGSEPFKVDISTYAPLTTDNYALELWFRCDENQSNENAVLLSSLNNMTIGFIDNKLTLTKSTRSIDADGQEVVTVNEQTQLSNANYTDNLWHHFALNVRRGNSAIVYIDGKAVKTLPESSIPALNSHYLTVGGEQTLLDADGTNAGGTANLLTGDIDELRIWNAALTSKLLDQRRYERLDSTYSGLIGYFPMESITRTASGTVSTTFTTENVGSKKVLRLKGEGPLTPSVNAPALLPGSQHMRLDKREFDFTASADQIYFSFPDAMLPKMDGNDFYVTVENIKDEHGNLSEPVSWMFHADFASMDWLEEEKVLEKRWDETTSFTTNLFTFGDSKEPRTYEIVNLPNWLEVNEPIGTMSQNMKTLTFTVLPTLPVGNYEEYIYVSDNNGITRSFRLSIKVTGDVPDWTVNPSLYESNMAVCGQIYIGSVVVNNPDSKLAAFDSDGNCRGVAQPKYIGTRDSYYVNMLIYGGSATELSSGSRDMTFKFYDASTGRTYTVMEYVYQGKNSTEMTYSPDALIGSYDTPVNFRTTDYLQQTVQLNKGWTWMSIYVDLPSTAIGDVLPQGNELKKLQNIKGHRAFATVSKNGVMGELKEMVPGAMYKIQTSANVQIEMTGNAINLYDKTLTIYEGFNWIGTLANVVMSPEQAFAGLQPVNGDVVKTRAAFSSYRDGVWEGELRNIVPGEGYIYCSKDPKAKTFHFPKLFNNSYGAPAMQRAPRRALFFEPVDEHLYPDNMNMIAVVKKDGQQVEDAEVAAFVNGECRGAVECNNGYYFLTALGSSENDMERVVEIVVRIDGEEYTVAGLPFVSDALYGSLDEPYVLDVDATAIRTVNIDDIDDDTDWFTLQGVKLNGRPSQQGVYLHHGEKVVIKR